jgi:hypothetical protein
MSGGVPIDFRCRELRRTASASRPGGAVAARGIPSGDEWVARNPRRSDRRPGSFKVNLRTRRWADFAIGVTGGDPVSSAAYLAGIGQAHAARSLAVMLGVGRG